MGKDSINLDCAVGISCKSDMCLSVIQCLVFLSDAIGMLLREEQSVSNLDSLELELCEAMALMERDFPCVIQVSFIFLLLLYIICCLLLTCVCKSRHISTFPAILFKHFDCA